MITNDAEYDIRFSRLLDKTVLKEWVSHPEVLRWFPMEGEKEIEMMVRNWAGFSRYRSSLTATYDHKPIGMATLFLMPYQKVAHLAMLNIVVAPHMQRKGVGMSLVRNIVHLAKNQFKLKSVHIELVEGCPLIPLLKKQNFTRVFRQEDYFEVNGVKRAREVWEVQIEQA